MTPRVGSISYVALGGLSEPQFSEESWKNNTIFPDCEAPRLVTRVGLTQYTLEQDGGLPALEVLILLMQQRGPRGLGLQGSPASNSTSGCV